jgi:ribose 5-phosphate isomerase B
MGDERVSTTPGTVYIASDHGGFALKSLLADHLDKRGFVVQDLGPATETSCDYPDFAHELCEKVLEDVGSTGILVCGTGIGMSMAANRHKGIRAALCCSETAARLTREHNDANVLCLGQRMLGDVVALAIVDAFFESSFEGGRHARRIEKIES